MHKLFIGLLTLISLDSFGQLRSDRLLMSIDSTSLQQSKSSKIIRHSKAFYDYDLAYAFKKIPFETPFARVATKVKLKKTDFLGEYLILDSSYLTYGSNYFDEGNFTFVSEKFQGVLLIKHDSLDNHDKILQNLTEAFGKPYKNNYESKSAFYWFGKNLNVALVYHKFNGKNDVSLFITSSHINIGETDNM